MLATSQLTFSFQNTRVLQDASLTVPPGSAYGFLGENGAGKSTTLKLLLGLLPPEQGTVSAFGAPMHRHAYNLHRRIGALVEDPPLYPHLSGRDNLAVTAKYRGLPDSRIEKVLGLVHLQKVAHRKVRGYSTGMKQRLGIALALLPDPELLILDEPTNGLDPQGIIDVRHLIQRLHREEGKTIVMSSHLLPEVESICTHVGILHRSRLLFQGTLSELRATTNSNGLSVRVMVDSSAKAKRTLKSEYAAQSDAGGITVHLTSRDEITPLIDRLRQAGISIYSVTPTELTLEDLYLQLTHEHPSA
jgi:ABC-2 type transport system ATP-binding protein